MKRAKRKKLRVEEEEAIEKKKETERCNGEMMGLHLCPSFYTAGRGSGRGGIRGRGRGVWLAAKVKPCQLG